MDTDTAPVGSPFNQTRPAPEKGIALTSNAAKTHRIESRQNNDLQRAPANETG
jgi:hypothetical protein